MIEAILWALSVIAAFAVPALMFGKSQNPVVMFVGYAGLCVLPVLWVIALGERLA